MGLVAVFLGCVAAAAPLCLNLGFVLCIVKPFCLLRKKRKINTKITNICQDSVSLVNVLFLSNPSALLVSLPVIVACKTKFPLCIICISFLQSSVYLFHKMLEFRILLVILNSLWLYAWSHDMHIMIYHDIMINAWYAWYQTGCWEVKEYGQSVIAKPTPNVCCLLVCSLNLVLVWGSRVLSWVFQMYFAISWVKASTLSCPWISQEEQVHVLGVGLCM